MKKILLPMLAAVALFLSPWQQTEAQAQQPKRAVVKVNVLSPFALTGSGFLEYAITDRVSAQLGAFTTGVTISDVKFKGHGFTPEVRYYISDSKMAPAGPYLAGYGRIQNFKLTVKNNKEDGRDYSATYSPIGAGAAIGNQWIFNSGISLDVFLGAGYNGGSLKINAGTENDFDAGFLGDIILGSGFGFRPGITLGYNF